MMCFKKNETIKSAIEMTDYEKVSIRNTVYPMLVKKDAPRKRDRKPLISAFKARVFKSIRNRGVN